MRDAPSASSITRLTALLFNAEPTSAVTAVSDEDSDVAVAPHGHLVSLLALACAKLQTLCGIARLWVQVVQELRWRWERGMQVLPHPSYHCASAQRSWSLSPRFYQQNQTALVSCRFKRLKAKSCQSDRCLFRCHAWASLGTRMARNGSNRVCRVAWTEIILRSVAVIETVQVIHVAWFQLKVLTM
jgi:hypothetical protein